MNILNDYKNLLKYDGELDYKSDSGLKYEELYDDGYIDWLKEKCKKYNIKFNKNEIDWEFCNYIHNKQSELEKRLEELLLIDDSMNKNISKMTFEELIKLDLEHCKKILEEKQNLINYDKDAEAWYIYDEEIIDYLWYEDNTIIHPKELIGYIEEYIEDVMKISKDRILADIQEEELDNQIKDTLPDDEL